MCKVSTTARPLMLKQRKCGRKAQETIQHVSDKEYDRQEMSLLQVFYFKRTGYARALPTDSDVRKLAADTRRHSDRGSPEE
jgi:hypothetical protein